MVIAFFCVLGYLMPYLCKFTPSRPTRMYSFSCLCIGIDSIFINSDAEESIITRGDGRTCHSIHETSQKYTTNLIKH